MAAYAAGATKNPPLDGLADVAGFSSARPGVAYAVVRDHPGTPYKPIPITAAAVALDGTGGLEHNDRGEIKIAAKDGLALSADWVEVFLID